MGSRLGLGFGSRLGLLLGLGFGSGSEMGLGMLVRVTGEDDWLG